MVRQGLQFICFVDAQDGGIDESGDLILIDSGLLGSVQSQISSLLLLHLLESSPSVSASPSHMFSRLPATEKPHVKDKTVSTLPNASLN